MRTAALLHLTFAAAALLGLGSAAAASPADDCLASCKSPSLSADDQATCRLECALVAQPAPPVAQPVRPTAPAQPIAAPRPAQPTSQPTQPTSQPSTHQKALCESQCDAEPVASDRATCRLQCAQQARPVAAPVSPAPGGTTGPVTSYSFPPGGGPAPTPTATSGATAPQQQQQIAACQATCDREASATDRATCRNNCGAVGTVLGPAAPGRWVLGPAPATSDAEQRAAVIRSSTGVAGSTPAARPVAVPTSQSATPASQPIAAQPNSAQCAAQAQTCALPCANEQQACTAQCNAGKLSSTDLATCHLTCESAGDMCRDDCRLKEAACRGPVYR